MNHFLRSTCLVISASCLVAAAQQAPEQALKYHDVLLKRPHNAALFDRFFGAWLDEQPVESLGAFLEARATAEGGAHWTVLARYELRRGNEEDALAALAQAIEAQPEDLALPMERAKLRLRRLEFEAAREDFARVTGDEVLALEAAKLIGKSWLREGKTEEAIKVWDAVLAAHPGDEDLLEDLVETAAAESETAQALVYAGKLIEVSRDPYQTTLRMLRRGDLLAQAGKNDEAVEAYAATLTQVGEGSWLEREVVAQIEKVFRKQDRLDDLSNEMKKLADAYPQRLLIQRQLAKLEAAQGEMDTAVGRFREVLKRLPGEREVRDEFVRLLVDGERLDEAVVELEKLIELTPADAGLHLQVAGLRSRQNQPEAVLAALRKAHELLGNDEVNGLRIAGLMLQYGLSEPGESLLKNLPGPSAMEALATHFGRTGRKDEAIELLQKAGAGDDVDGLLRTCGSISGLGESALAFEILAARVEKFSTEPRFLAALVQSALAAGKPAEAVPQALKLVRLAKQSGELAESIGLATRVIIAAENKEVSTALAAQATRTPAETCLLAALSEHYGNFVEADSLLERNSDPLVIQFHTALLDRRDDFGQAIAVLSRLADTPDGRTAGYFRDLSRLQQRAGRTIEALATIERWKLAAPGDKTAWITGSHLLRESGKPEEAVKMTRQAVGRFEGDADLSASLASLQVEAGQWQEAEAIYWKLYDEGQSPADQSRWATQLAQLALRTGRIQDLEDKLRERARGNRRSIGPLLALAELARVMEKADKRRDFLLEALRLQPKDLDLRFQVALLEEEVGNGDRALVLLEEALAFDDGNRVRTALAQAYLRLGQAVKGLRELRQLSGKTGFDARSAENAATSLAGSMLYAEAIDFLRAELPDGGDWRTRYLLAVLLEEDGREAEALPIFLDLLQPKEAIPGVVAPAAANFANPYSEPAQAMFRLMTARESAYLHRNPDSGHPLGFGITGRFSLPNTPEDLREFALIHLCTLAKKQTGRIDPLIRQQIEAAGVDNLDFVTDLPANRLHSEPELSKLLLKYPDQPGLLEMMLTRHGRPIGRELILRLLEHEAKLSPKDRFIAWSFAAAGTKPENSAWESLWAAAKECIAAGSTVNARLTALLQNEGDCPEIHRPAVKQLLLDDLAATIKAGPESAHDGHALAVLSIAGTPEAWLEEMNATVREFRKTGAPAVPTTAQHVHYGNLLQWIHRSGTPSPDEKPVFNIPTLYTLPFRSIPPTVIERLRGVRGRPGSEPFSLFELAKISARIESPMIRAWLAICVADDEALASAMAVAPPAEEAADFDLLRALLFTEANQPGDAIAALIKARAAAGTDRGQISSINLTLLAVASTMTPDERVAHNAQLQSTILQTSQILGTHVAWMIAAQAKELGFPELARRITPTARTNSAIMGPAANAPSRRYAPGLPHSQSFAPDKIRKLIAGKKFEAAAREILHDIRSRNASGMQEYYEVTFPVLADQLGKEGRAKLLELVDPGETKSLLKRLEYVDVCNALGLTDLAAAALEAIAKDRPDDAAIATRLVLSSSAHRSDRLVELMSKACRWDGFVTEVSAFATRLGKRKDNQATMDFFEMVTRWLETVDPQSIQMVNLTWVSFHGKQFFVGDCTSGLPTLFSSDTGKEADRELIERRTAIGGRLARAMMRHAACAEEGFRLLAAARAWRIEPAELDKWARTALLAGAGGPSVNVSSSTYFTLDRGNEIADTTLTLPQFASATWLVTRLREVENPSEIFPPEFIATLQQRNPEVGDFMSILSRDLKDGDLAALWNSDVMKSSGSRLSQMLRPLMLKQMALSPDAPQFLTARITEIPPGTAVKRYANNETEATEMLFIAALAGAATGKPGEMESVARAISRAVFGENPDFKRAGNHEALAPRVKFMESLCEGFAADPVVMVRMQAAFFHIGTPLGYSGPNARLQFGAEYFATMDEAVAFLNSLGWLADVGVWEPYMTLIYRKTNNASKNHNTLNPTLLLEQAFHNSRRSPIIGDLIKRLKERETGRFGSLMVAAMLATGAERIALTSQAFAESSAELAKFPPERVDTFSLFLPLLTDETKAKLPETFQRKVREADAIDRAAVLTTAQTFMTTLKGADGGRSIESVHHVVTALLPYDLDQAVAIFVAADQAFTDSLASGGQFSSSSTGDFEISERDAAFSRIAEALHDRGTVPFELLAKILASPSGRRLHVNDAEISKMGKRVAGKGGGKIPIDRFVGAFKALAPELKSVALACFLLADLQLAEIPDANDRKALLSQLAKDPQTVRLVKARLALESWSDFTPGEKADARTTLTSVIADASIHDALRMAMAVEFLSKISQSELLDPSFSKALVRLYQIYCGGERSAVSPDSNRLFRQLSNSPARDKPTHAALARTFWENASTSKPAGHATIPDSLAQGVLITALIGDDGDLVAEIFPRFKPGMVRKLVPMISLMQHGRPDLVKQLAPLPAETLLGEPHEFHYTRGLEESLSNFKQAGADEPTVRKLELAMLEFPIGTDEDAPAEPMEARVNRLVENFVAAPPEGKLFRLSMLQLLNRSPGNPKLLPLLDAWAKEHPVAVFLATRTHEAVTLHGIAATHALARGNASLLKAISEAIAMPPAGGDSDLTEMKQNLVGTFLEMSRAIWSDVCAGHTSGYKAGLPVWNDFVVEFAEQTGSRNPSAITGVLAASHYLACWSGEPAEFEKMCERLPKSLASYQQNFSREQGFASFVLASRERSNLRQFIENTLCQPGFGDQLSKQVWLDLLAQNGCGDVMVSIALNPPAGMVPEAHPALYDLQARRLRSAMHADAAAVLRKGIEVCQAGADWNSHRSALKLQLVDLLFAADQVTEAKTLFATIPPGEVAERQKKRHERLAKILAPPLESR